MADQTKQATLGEMSAEFLGTLTLIALGDGVVAMVVLFANQKGDYTNITLGWGLAVLMGICIAGRVSGAHLNPAVTLTMALFRGFAWSKVPGYMGAQFAGAFCGAALVFLNYLPAFRAIDPDLSETAGVFTTFPASFPETTWMTSLFDQIVGTAILLAMILAITDPRNQPVAKGLEPILIGLVVVAIGVSWGGMHGYAINPARDFGPRLFTVVAGFKNTGFADGVFWVPIVGPLLGGIAGALGYDRMILPFLPQRTASS
jgi:glycerol uptake facilitator protein